VIFPDVNLLVYAFRTDAAHHAICRTWLNKLIAGDAKFALSKLSLSALVRITTNRRSYPLVSSLEDAFGFCDDLLKQPHCQIIEPGDRHWDIFQRLCVETNTRGPTITDAWYAALAVEWSCELLTFDRDFTRFPDLKCTILPSRQG